MKVLEKIKDLVDTQILEDKEYIDNLNYGSSMVLLTLIEDCKNIDLEIQKMFNPDDFYDDVQEMLDTISNYIFYINEYDLECVLNNNGVQIILRK